jgi:hypothetical protein
MRHDVLRLCLHHCRRLFDYVHLVELFCILRFCSLRKVEGARNHRGAVDNYNLTGRNSMLVIDEELGGVLNVEIQRA